MQDGTGFGKMDKKQGSKENINDAIIILKSNQTWNSVKILIIFSIKTTELLKYLVFSRDFYVCIT